MWMTLNRKPRRWVKTGVSVGCQPSTGKKLWFIVRHVDYVQHNHNNVQASARHPLFCNISSIYIHICITYSPWLESKHDSYQDLPARPGLKSHLSISGCLQRSGSGSHRRKWIQFCAVSIKKIWASSWIRSLWITQAVPMHWTSTSFPPLSAQLHLGGYSWVY